MEHETSRDSKIQLQIPELHSEVDYVADDSKHVLQ